MRQAMPGARLIDQVGPPIQQDTMPAFQGRTLYVAFEIHEMNFSFRDIAIIRAPSGVRADGMLTIRNAAAGSPSCVVRVDTVNGSNNVWASTQRLAVGRHIAWATINDGMTLAQIGVNSPTAGAKTATVPGDGMPGSQVVGTSAEGFYTNLAVLGYPEEHDERKRALVMNYLNRTLSLSLSLSKLFAKLTSGWRRESRSGGEPPRRYRGRTGRHAHHAWLAAVTRLRGIRGSNAVCGVESAANAPGVGETGLNLWFWIQSHDFAGGRGRHLIVFAVRHDFRRSECHSAAGIEHGVHSHCALGEQRDYDSFHTDLGCAGDAAFDPARRRDGGCSRSEHHGTCKCRANRRGLPRSTRRHDQAAGHAQAFGARAFVGVA